MKPFFSLEEGKWEESKQRRGTQWWTGYRKVCIQYDFGHFVATRFLFSCVSMSIVKEKAKPINKSKFDITFHFQVS